MSDPHTSDYNAARAGDDLSADGGSESRATGSIAGSSDDQYTLVDLLTVLARRKRMLLVFPAVVAILTALLSLLLPNIYTATARILPPQQSQSQGTAMLGQLGIVSGISGAGIALKGRNDLYIGMLKSRTVGDAIIARFDLNKRYGHGHQSVTRATLAGQSSFNSGNDGIIVIDVDDPDPKTAAALANAYVDELYRLTQSLAVTEASHRRLFFEKQLKLAKANLASAEVELKRTQQETGLIRLDDQARALIENIARTRGQVSAKEVQLSVMREFATASNPDYLRAQQELKELRAQLARSERDKGAEPGVFMSTGKIPETGLEYIRKLRDVKYHETVFELLAKQLEVAKIDEAREGSLIQVLDEAVIPEVKSKPQRLKLVLLAMLGALLVAIAWALLADAFSRALLDPIYSRRLRRFRESLTH